MCILILFDHVNLTMVQLQKLFVNEMQTKEKRHCLHFLSPFKKAKSIQYRQ